MDARVNETDGLLSRRGSDLEERANKKTGDGLPKATALLVASLAEQVATQARTVAALEERVKALEGDR